MKPVVSFSFHRRVLRRSSSSLGVTLIDLTICVMVMGILAAVAAPRFASALAKLQCEAVAKRIAGDLNYARRSAMQTSRLATVVFRMSPPGYDMVGVEAPNFPGQNYAVNLIDIDANVNLSAVSFDGSMAISFNNYGRPLVAGLPLVNNQVTVASGAHAFQVIVDAGSGEASVR